MDGAEMAGWIDGWGSRSKRAGLQGEPQPAAQVMVGRGCTVGQGDEGAREGGRWRGAGANRAATGKTEQHPTSRLLSSPSLSLS